MGGIVGVIGRTGLADRAVLVRQTELLLNRGPDDGAVYVSGPFGLGYRRVDAEGLAHQPCWDEEGRIGVVIDADLEGLGDLAAGLSARGHRLRAVDPPSVLVAAYREWGDGCVDHLSGSFALAILDRAAGHLLLARDRVGARPLYYHSGPRRFGFASELRALLGDPGVPRVLDPGPVLAWFRLGFVPEPMTLLRDVRAVEPGEVLLVERDRIRSRRYWSPGDVSVGPEWAVAHLRERLEAAAVRSSRDRAQVALSGGRISTSLAAWIALRRGPVRTVSVSGLDGFDTVAAREVSRELGFEHREVALVREPVDALGTALEAMDLPFSDPFFVNQIGLARALSRPDPAERSELVRRAVLLGIGAHEILGERPLRVAAAFALSPAFLAGPAALEAASLEPEAIPLATRLSSVALRYADRASTIAQRPVRAALVDPDVLEAVAALRGDQPGWDRISRGLVPGRLAAEAHRRAAPPLTPWMRGAVNALVEGLLFERPGGASGLLDTRRLRRWWYAHQLGFSDRAMEIWQSVVFEHWYRSVVVGEGFDPAPRRRRRGSGYRPARSGRGRPSTGSGAPRASDAASAG